MQGSHLEPLLQYAERRHAGAGIGNPDPRTTGLADHRSDTLVEVRAADTREERRP